ncbi:MAG TPA: hypothetical protein H9919_06395 [Candidatus Alistipes excrementipullorum]|nr:hypothetical protein [Candidatus Alistipes excrementipullorum]
MSDFKEYMATGGACGPVSDEELDRLISEYEWFSTARMIRSHQRGVVSSRLAVTSASRSVSSLDMKRIDFGCDGDADNERLIERFLQLDNYRIVADDGADDEQISTEAQLSDEDDVVSEELAEVYLAQGLVDEAKAIYRKLSLLNPEKSVYFAELIDNIDKTEKQIN